MNTQRERLDACTERLTNWWNADKQNCIEEFEPFFQADGFVQALVAVLDAGGTFPDSLVDEAEERVDEVDNP